ncbi:MULTISPECIES: hypothetical protein [unclassified Streptomyces]|uniref:hypothetical protein n=1 Tax=unclassified Streptomyces TaxID=2593676 RepID=UPI0022B68758|nr:MULTISPECIES: hypothetical protein [unclassified Streptomyces]MCZ7413800.1 hypothetical protein [Streptomyces sp. WMMC897]MCZ7430796.1 hypothetical protein [Streptomyces sp. WMMC1477]
MRPSPPQQDTAPHEQPADPRPGWASAPPPSGPNGPAIGALDLPEPGGYEDAGPWASTGCLEHYGYPAGDAAPGDLTHCLLLPSPEGWELSGQRGVLCAYMREGGGMLEGSLVD